MPVKKNELWITGKTKEESYHNAYGWARLGSMGGWRRKKERIDTKVPEENHHRALMAPKVVSQHLHTTLYEGGFLSKTKHGMGDVNLEWARGLDPGSLLYQYNFINAECQCLDLPWLILHFVLIDSVSV